MPHHDEQLRTLGKALEKMQHESDKSFSRNGKKAKKQIIFFATGSTLLCTGLLFLLTGLCTAYLQNVTAVIFITAGLMMMFFQSSKTYGVIVTFLSLIIFAQIFAFDADYSLIAKDGFRYVLIFSATSVGTVLLLISFFNKRHDDKK